MLLNYIRNFGFRLTLISAFSRILRIISISSATIKKYDSYKYKRIRMFLENKLCKYIDENDVKYRTDIKDKIQEDAFIWIMWLQGEDNAPLIVKKCIASIKLHAKCHKVVVLTEKNWHEYLNIPEYIIDKFKHGKMSRTHFSDICRMAALSQHGGIWMDATILMTGEFPKEMYEYPYYTLHGAFDFVPWTTFFQGCGKNNGFAKYVYGLFLEYLRVYDYFIAYLVQDVLMYIGYRKLPYAKDMIDGIPAVDNSVFILNDSMLENKYSEQDWEYICNKSFIHKLSYKYKHEEIVNGETTMWGYICRDL